MKVLLSGAATALVFGIFLGRAMAPDLGVSAERPQGPQIFAYGGDDRSGSADQLAVTAVAYPSRDGRIPDYVLGTDWKKSLAEPDATPTRPPKVEVRDDQPDLDAGDPPPLVRTAYNEPSHAREGYPSLGGARAMSAEDAQSDAATGATDEPTGH